jgi:DNA polymerase-3 subunit gamma/tau
VSENLKQRYAAQAQNCTMNFLLRALALISKTDVNFKSARNQRLLVEMTLMQLTFLPASADAEKKKDESESVVQQPAPTSPNTQPVKASAIAEPEIRVTSKPTLGFNQLKIQSAFSLNEMKSGQNGKTENPESKTETVIVTENQPITLEDVTNAVKEYAGIKLQQGQRQLSITLSTSSLRLNDTAVTLTISNETQREQLQNIRQDFLDVIRKKLQNNRLNLEIETAVVEVQAKAFKPSDIFKQMSQKNPALLELKKRFDLEIDY